MNSRCVVCGISERRVAQQNRSSRGEPATQLSSHQPRDAIGRTSADCQPPSIFSPAPSHAACSLQFHAAEPGICEWTRGQATGLWRGTPARGGGWPWLAPGLAAPVRTYAVGRSCRTILLSKPCLLGAQESEGEYKTKLRTSLQSSSNSSKQVLHYNHSFNCLINSLVEDNQTTQHQNAVLHRHPRPRRHRLGPVRSLKWHLLRRRGCFLRRRALPVICLQRCRRTLPLGIRHCVRQAVRHRRR